MSNFEGIQKGGRTFRPQGSGGEDVVIGRVVAGGYEGTPAPVLFEKATPVLDTTPTPRTDGRGESELGLSGLVDHPDRDGHAQYYTDPRTLAGRIARLYGRMVADGADLETLSVEQRRQMRDQLIQGVYDGDGQHPSGEAASQGQKDVLAYITGIANVLFGLADEIPGTPEFLTRSTGGFVHKMVNGVSTFVMEGGDGGSMHKSASHAELVCPFCSGVNLVERNSIGGLQKITCSSCAGKWQQDLAISTFTKSSDNPDLAALRKELDTLKENIRRILAQRAGAILTESSDRGSRFITKGKTVAERELHKALANGTPVAFSGQDPRTEAEKASGSGRRFQPK